MSVSLSRLNEFIPMKDSLDEEKHLKSIFSCDSLSLISSQATPKDLPNDQISSFYLGDYHCMKEKQVNSSYLSMKNASMRTNENP
jgi:hypothetical protein